MAILDSLLFQAFEPKQQNRFVLNTPDDILPAFMVRTAATPSFDDEEVTMHYINTYRKIRGKRTWNNVDLTLYDPITPSGAQAVMDWARLSYESVTGRAGYSDFYKKDVTLQQLGPVGDIVGEWIMKGAFVLSGDFGTYDWASSDVADVSVTLAYDYAILNF